MAEGHLAHHTFGMHSHVAASAQSLIHLIKGAQSRTESPKTGVRCGSVQVRPKAAQAKTSTPTAPAHRFAPAAPNEAYRFAPVCTGSERSCSDVRISLSGAVRFHSGAPSVCRFKGAYRTAPQRAICIRCGWKIRFGSVPVRQPS